MATDIYLEDILRLLLGKPVSPDAASSVLSRSPGVYAWWGFPSVLPELPGRSNDEDPMLRLLYVGRATNLRGRILRNHLRRSGSSTLRRTLAGLLMPSEGYQTIWKNGVVLTPDDEQRLTSWMRRSLRLTWAEYPYPEEVEGDLVMRLRPPLNVHGVEESDVRTMVVAAKDAYDASASEPEDPS